MTPASLTTIGKPLRDRPRVYNSLQAGRGVAALMVVLYHCELLLAQPKYWFWTRYYLYFGAGGVDFFFVLSGIVILYAHQSEIGRPNKLATYAWKRFRRIYPIYWMVLFALLPIYFVTPLVGNRAEIHPGVIAGSILLLPLTRAEPILPVAWTLFHEVSFYLVFSLMLVHRRLGSVALSLWMLASLAALFVPFHSPTLAFYASPLHLLFGLGMLIPPAIQRLKWQGAWLAGIGALLLVICAVSEDLLHSPYQLLQLAFGLFSGMLACGLMLLERAGRLRVPATLLLLGDASYSLYLIHCPVLSLMAKLIYPLWLRHHFPMVFPFMLLFAASVTSGLCLHLWVERPLLRYLTTAQKPVDLPGQAWFPFKLNSIKTHLLG